MVTRRSLNKLERKAHMSIHHTKEVKDGDEPRPFSSQKFYLQKERDEPLSSFTKDRFGKKHKVVSRTDKNDQSHG